MRIFRFILAFAATVLCIWQLSISHKTGDKSLPSIGDFFNPFTGFWCNAEASNAWAKSDISQKLPGLQGKVEVIMDKNLIPHIFAENMEDAARVQGYLTAQQRLWQMDIGARKAGGRLSEVLGERTLSVDRLTRRRGMVYAAENSLIGLQKDPASLRLLDAYVAGVNAWINQLSPADYPIEFKLLGYAPEPWTMLKTALMIENMADMLAGGDSDLSATNALAQFGRATFDSLYPAFIPKQIPVIPDTGQWKNLHSPLATYHPTNADLSKLEPSPLEDRSGLLSEGPEGYLRGSNNWAIQGKRSASGHPILANDPHLNLTLPSIWYQIQIHTPQMNCYGVSLPGIPNVVIGFNDDIAWGVTNVSHDVADWFKIHWLDGAHETYELDGSKTVVKKRVEKIEIRGAQTLYDTVRYTFFGPVVYDFDPKSPLHDCAYKWVSHDVPKENLITGFLQLNCGKNWQDYQSGISGFDCPAQNFVFASRSGDIGLQVQGRFPLRMPEQGRFVMEGNKTANGWNAYIPQNEVPSMKNPSRQYVFSANQISTPQSYPFYYLGNFDAFRGRRADQILQSLTNGTVDSMKNMQLDNYSIRAAEAAPAMLKCLDRSRLDETGRKMADEIEHWNHWYQPEFQAPVYFDVWWDSTYLNIWDEITRLQKANVSIKYPDAWRTIQMLESEPNNRFFDHPETPNKETAREVVTEAFLNMQKFFKENPGQNTDWGHFHALDIKHLAGIDGFSRLKMPIGGHKTALNAIGKSNGPSWRMIVSLEEKTRAYGVYPGGQSGNPGSRFYDNMVDTWMQGQYNDLWLMQSSGDAPDQMLAKITFTAQ